MNNLSTNVLKQLSINNKKYLFFLKNLSKKLCPSRTNFKTTIRKSINHTKSVYIVGKKVLKWVNASLKVVTNFSFSQELLYQEMTTFHFFLFKGKRHVWITSKIITKFWEVFSWFKENKNVINISSVKNWFKFFWALFRPWYFTRKNFMVKTQENIFHSWSERRSHGHAILLFIKNITKYEMPFLSSQRQKVLNFI